MRNAVIEVINKKRNGRMLNAFAFVTVFVYQEIWILFRTQ